MMYNSYVETGVEKYFRVELILSFFDQTATISLLFSTEALLKTDVL